MSRATASVLACLLACAGPSRAGDDALSGDVTLVSDYLFRGVSQTSGRPALQAGLRYDHGSGAYVAGWASNVDFDDEASHEIDGTIGWAGGFGPVTVDVAYSRYAYPGASGYDYGEWLVSARLGNHWSIATGFTSNALAEGVDGRYAQLAYVHPVGENIALRAAAGECRFGGVLDDYRHAEMGATWSRGPWVARLTLHGSSAAARRNFGSAAAQRRIEAAVTFGF